MLLRRLKSRAPSGHGSTVDPQSVRQRVRVRLRDSRLIEGFVSPWSSPDVLLLEHVSVYGSTGKTIPRQPQDCFVLVSQAESIEYVGQRPSSSSRQAPSARLSQVLLLLTVIFSLSIVLGFVVGINTRTNRAAQVSARGVSGRVHINLFEKDGTQGVEVVSGNLDLNALDDSLGRLGRPNVLRRQAGPAWLLTRSVVLREATALELSDVELRLLSREGQSVGLEARGGTLDVRRSLVTSWNPEEGAPDGNVSDGRAWVLARDGGQLNVVDSGMQMLGYDEPERYGVSWRTPGTGGEVQDALFSGNYYGLYTYDVEPMVVRDSVIERSHMYGLDPHTNSEGFLVEGNTFRDNGKHGMILAVGCSGAIVHNNEAYGNGGHGIVVFSDSDDTSIIDNEIHDNRGSGIDISNSDLVDLTSNIVYGNGTGITVHDGASTIRIAGNRVSANRGDGIRISSGAVLASITDNLVDFNYSAGLYLDEGVRTLVARNRVLDNLTGMRLEDSDRGARVLENNISNNASDGIALQDAPAATIVDNVISANEQAAFSVTRLGAAKPFVSSNVVGNHPEGKERLRDD